MARAGHQLVCVVKQSGLADTHAGLYGYIQCCNSQREWWQSDCRSWSIEADMLLVRRNLHDRQNRNMLSATM